MKLLLVEDEALVSNFVKLVLREEGHSVDVVRTTGEARDVAAVHDHDALIVDFHLPDGTGLDVVQAVRGRGSPVPILMLSGVGDEDTVVACLDAGADGYLTKPFGVAELKARVRALVRRAAPVPEDRLQLGSFVMERLARRVRVNGREISLTPREFALAEYLLLRGGTPVSRGELLEKVWEMNFDPGSNLVDVHVARLRGKLQRAGADVSIETVRGVGFMLVEDPPTATEPHRT